MRALLFADSCVGNQVLALFSDLPRCVVHIEACPGAHYWGRQLAALSHQVRLMPPHYVRPYVKRQINDSADAEAICEAMSRLTMGPIRPLDSYRECVSVAPVLIRWRRFVLWAGRDFEGETMPRSHSKGLTADARETYEGGEKITLQIMAADISRATIRRNINFYHSIIPSSDFHPVAVANRDHRGFGAR
jgi:hypothetical protein